MANEEHLAQLVQGVDSWNQWREKNPKVRPDLSGADLRGADLRGADLRGADLHEATLYWADLSEANLRGANLNGAFLDGANLHEANLHEAILDMAELCRADLSKAKLGEAHLGRADLGGADLSEADLCMANLGGAKLGEATLRGANLRWTNLHETNLAGASFTGAQLIETNLTNANLTGCRIYGVSAWNLTLEGAQQKDLIITRDYEPVITVDNLEVAQFIYLLLNNKKIRDVIDTITSKAVLILGRFTPERKAVLDTLREELRKRNYLPIMFDFDKPASKDLTGTVSTLANMARFIVADLTDPRSVPHELATVVRDTVVPVQPILLEGQQEYAMFMDLKRRHHWVLEPYQYSSSEQLIAQLEERVIAPAEAKAEELKKST
jgi:uncharacterized protein YjbI with pentapeptide repeats